jgi:RNA polymerase sigma-70 factor (ECF subfamily)
MDDRSDAWLLERWSRGDTEAFEALVLRHQSPLLRHARALLGDARGAEDVVQEVFLRLAQKPPAPTAVQAVGDVAGDGAESVWLAAWLHTVTRNLSLDAMRSERRRKRREEAVAPAEATTEGLSAVEAADTRAAVERGLAELAPDQREVLVLRLFGDRSYKEIAAITGKNVGTIGWLISVGLRRLATELAPLVAHVTESPKRGAFERELGRLQGELS